MKRIYKFLMPLVAIVALALPVSMAAQTTCQLKIVGEDAYADGWNGGSLAVVQGGTTVATFNAANADNNGMGPELDSTTVTVSDAPVSFVWSSGNYDDEVTIWIYTSSGTLLFTVTEPDPGTIFSMNSPCSDCFAPSASVDSLASDAARIAWSGDATSYGYLWGTAADMAASGGTSGTTTDSYLELTSLTSSTAYTVMVWSDCGTETSDTVTINFTTPGEAVTTFPYSTGFEADDDTVWSFNNTGGANGWYLGTATNNTTGGTRALYISNDNGTSNAYTITTTSNNYAYRGFVLPAGQYTLSYDWKAYGESCCDYLQVYMVPGTVDMTLSNLSNTGWTNIGGGNKNVQSDWQNEAMVFTVTNGGLYYLVFKWHNDGSVGTNPPAAIDNIAINQLTCSAPVALTVDSLTTTEIMLSWTATNNESAWQISINDSLIDVTTTTYTIDNLEINTPYNIKVRAICSSDDTSFYSEVVNTRTLAGAPLTTPYFCGFEVTDDGNQASAWVMENGSNGWYVGTATNNGGEKALYISDNNGVANNYSSSASVSYAYVSFQLDAGEYAYSFDWKCQGESTWDFLRVAYAPYGTALPSDYSSWGTGAAAPAGFTGIDGGKLNLETNWQTKAGTFNVTTAGVYNLYFVWRNDGSVFNSPGAAIDNVQLVQNTCPAPRNLTATNVTTDSIVVAWNAGGEETTWEIAIGNEDPVEINDSTYVFDNLNANTVYAIRVRGICGADDTSMWATLSVRTDCGLLTVLPYTEDFESVGTTSSSNNNFIPCWFKVNNATSTYYPYVSNSTSYNHTDGGTMGLYWYSTTTASYGTYRMIVLPGVDTNEIPMNTTMLTFWAKPSSSGYSVVFYVGVMSDPTADSTFQYYDTIALPSNSTNWAKYTVMLDGFTGTGNHVAIRENTGASYWYAYVDDITLDVIPDCPAVENLDVQAGPVSAIVNWDVVGNGYTGALVEYRADSTDNWSSITVTDNYAAITGLDPETGYTVRVSAICGDANANPVSATFATMSFGCAQFDTTNLINVTIGHGTTTSSYIPSYSFYNYGYSQQFFTASEIGSSGVISKVTLYPSAIAQQRTYEIYMGQSTDSAASQFINPTGLTCVYNGGPVNLVANQPVTFELTSPFNYSDSSNLVVIFRDMTGSYVSGNSWTGDNAWTNASRYIYQDASAYTPGSVSNGTASDFRNKITLFGGTCLQQSTCAAPLPVVYNVGTTTVSVAWAPGNGETQWNVYYRQVGADSWSAPVTVTTTNYTFTGLNSGMNYEFKVENVCGTEILSNTVSATTLCATISSLPFNENFNSWGAGSGVMPNCWYRTGSYSSYTYISSSYNRSGATGGSIYMYQSGSSHSAIFLPALDTNVYQANQTQLVFHVMNTSANYLHPGFEVGVLSDPDDISTFVPVDTVFHTVGPNIWEIFEVPLSGYTGNGAYVGFRTVDNPASGTQYTYTYPYLDDFTLELIPTCPRPDSLTAANATTNSVDLGWHERGSATTWIVEYGPRGFQPGTGTTVAANSNPFTLTGLPAAYQGEYYVKSICGAGDTGDYSRMPCAFGTSQIPATLPYNYDFENVTEWNNWQTSTNHATTNWYRGTSVADSGSYSMYVATSDTASYFSYSFNSVINAAIYRDIDFGAIDSSYTISFRARVGGTTTNSYDGLMVFLVDPSIAPVPSSSNITSPWGNVNDLYRIASVRLDTTWQTYEASFDTISGIHRVAFFWFNQNTGASYANIPEPAAVDNIHIRYSSCPRPVLLQAVNTGSSTATLTWQDASNATYEVVYRQTGSANQTVTANTNSITLTGLESAAEYRAWVRKLCGAGDTSLYSDGIIFNTDLCDNALIVATGDPDLTSTTSYNAPVNNFYNYTLSETIIDSAELVGTGSITALSYYYDYTDASTVKTDVTIWIQPTNKTAFSSSSDLEVLDTNNAVLVYSGNLNCSQGWNYFALTTPFVYSGNGNLMVIVDDNSGDYDGSSYVFRTAATTEYKTLTYYSDTYNPDPTTSSFSGSTSYYQWRPLMQLISCGGGNCEQPVIMNVDTAETSIAFNWVGYSSNYEVAIVEDAWVAPAAGTLVADTFYTFTGLTGSTNYYVAVRGVCGSTTSDWTYMPVTTLRHPCAMPTGVTVTNPTYSGATVSWNAGEDETAWEVNVSCSSPVYDHTYTVNDTPTVEVTGLDNGITYKVIVRALCDADWYSPWTDTVDLTTTTCPIVTGVTASGITATSATISWNSTGALSYEVEYGDMGFHTGDGHTVTSTTTSVVIDQYLEEQSTYDVFVRGMCADGVYSGWSEKYTFRTTAVGIEEVVNGNVVLYPNPASTMVTIRGIEGESTVTVVDLNGREVYKNTANSDLTIDLTGYAKGAYFVRITGESTTAIRKLIVK